jgi:hypothetical protein
VQGIGEDSPAPPIVLVVVLVLVVGRLSFVDGWRPTEATTRTTKRTIGGASTRLERPRPL